MCFFFGWSDDKNICVCFTHTHTYTWIDNERQWNEKLVHAGYICKNIDISIFFSQCNIHWRACMFCLAKSIANNKHIIRILGCPTTKQYDLFITYMLYLCVCIYFSTAKRKKKPALGSILRAILYFYISQTNSLVVFIHFIFILVLVWFYVKSCWMCMYFGFVVDVCELQFLIRKIRSNNSNVSLTSCDLRHLSSSFEWFAFVFVLFCFWTPKKNY